MIRKIAGLIVLIMVVTCLVVWRIVRGGSDGHD